MKKVFGMILAIVFSITSVMFTFSWLKNNKSANAVSSVLEFEESKLKNKQEIIDPLNLNASQHLDSRENMNPFDEETETMMPGYAVYPKTVGNEEEIDSFYTVKSFSLLPSESIYMWIFIPNQYNYELTIEFQTSTENYIKWKFSTIKLQDMLKSNEKDGFTFGWRLFELCVSDAEMSTAVSSSLSSHSFNAMSIKYTNFNGVFIDVNKNEFAFYHVYLADSFSNKSAIVKALYYSNYKFNDSFLSKKSFFVDEEILFTGVQDVFSYLYVGQYNLRDFTNANYSWKINVVDSAGKSHQKTFGEKFVFERYDSHNIEFTLTEYRVLSSAAVLFVSHSVNVGIFTLGAFTNVDYEVDKNETKLITFKFSNYFTYDPETVVVEVTDKTRAKTTYYIEDNTCYIKITGLKKGDIKISVQANGCKNGDYETATYKCSTAVEIKDPNKKSASEIFLWVILGIYAGGFTIFVVISLVKARRVSVK